MANVSIILATIFVLIIAATSPAAQGVDLSPGAVEKWFENLPNAKKNTTKLHFYFHNTVSDDNPSMDDTLTVGPELNSTMLGRALVINSPPNELGHLLAINLVFTEGEYNSSSLSVIGLEPVFNEYREMPIISGTGVFRLARGVATTKTYSFDEITNNYIAEYNVVVLHY